MKFMITLQIKKCYPIVLGRRSATRPSRLTDSSVVIRKLQGLWSWRTTDVSRPVSRAHAARHRATASGGIARRSILVRYRRTRGLSLIASLGFVANPASSCAAGGAYQLRDASRFATRVVRHLRKSSLLKFSKQPSVFGKDWNRHGQTLAVKILVVGDPFPQAPKQRANKCLAD